MRGHGSGVAGHRGADRRNELLGRDGLRQKAGEGRRTAFLRFSQYLAPERGDEWRSDAAFHRADQLRGLQAIEAGHAPVEQGDIVGCGAARGIVDALDGLHAARDHIGLPAERAHRARKNFASDGVVVGDENARAMLQDRAFVVCRKACFFDAERDVEPEAAAFA